MAGICRANILISETLPCKTIRLKHAKLSVSKISEIAQNAGRILLLHSLPYCYYRSVGNIWLSFTGECFGTWLFESQEDFFEVDG